MISGRPQIWSPKDGFSVLGRYAFTEKSKKALGNKQKNKFISIFQVTQLLNSAYRPGGGIKH